MLLVQLTILEDVLQFLTTILYQSRFFSNGQIFIPHDVTAQGIIPPHLVSSFVLSFYTGIQKGFSKTTDQSKYLKKLYPIDFLIMDGNRNFMKVKKNSLVCSAYFRSTIMGPSNLRPCCLRHELKKKPKYKLNIPHLGKRVIYLCIDLVYLYSQKLSFI